MCKYWEICTYNCEHEEIASAATPGSFCLFDKDPEICEQELGRFRILEIHVNNWCPRCERVAAEMRSRAKGRDFKTPSATPAELEQQTANRSKLSKMQFALQRRVNDKRKNRLSAVANKNLLAQMQRPDSYAAPVLAWIVQYLASLPPWLNRRRLMALLEPWFAPLLDEEQQICLQPALKKMGCEYLFDNVMVWTSS
ncbi:hypothetical protein F4781DRAFT_35966 [Annulohypoxylon bovei var. microspora]|nr:hypothetical protein F4781DRAFT_35966 [Annulohypoxylon bovei var. microspora]